MTTLAIWLTLMTFTAEPADSHRTHFEAPGFASINEILSDTVRQHYRAYKRDGKAFHMNHPWLRDNIHMMKGYKYWDKDLDGFLDVFIGLQHEDGFFYEIIGRSDHDHLPLVGPKHKLIEKDKNLAWIRLEIEADIEYLVVEAAYTAWQATGDQRALKRRLPALSKALQYMMTDPTRWDKTHGAVKRTFTIDTWDFTYGRADANTNRRIEPDMPMAIMHGDNSGLYAACRQLAEMYGVIGDRKQAMEWDKTADGLREHINRLCFNGKFYTHQVHLKPINTGVREEEILSLSNTYDINRHLPTHNMAVKIIDEYQSRGRERKDTHFAEWFSIDPPYPQFGDYKAGEYINGGIASFVAGELAKAAFEHGRERYGADILKRMVQKIHEDEAIYFLYTPEGKNQGGGPSGWGAAAVLSAMYEGLAGIRDEGALFDEVTISPRFVAAEMDHANVCTSYGPSDAYVAMVFDHDAQKGMIALELSGVSRKTHVRVLLPQGVEKAKVRSPQNIKSGIETIEQSKYIVFDLPQPLTDAPTLIDVRYGSE